MLFALCAGILGHKHQIDSFADPALKPWCSSKAGKVAKRRRYHCLSMWLTLKPQYVVTCFRACQLTPC